jgi:hypothetical protein
MKAVTNLKTQTTSSVETHPIFDRFKPPSSPVSTIFHRDSSQKTFITHPPEHALHYNFAWKCAITPIAIALLPLVTLAGAVVAAVYCLFNNITFKNLVAKTLGLPALSLDKNQLSQERRAIDNSNQVWVITEDRIRLNGLKVLHKDNPKKWVVFMNGNRGAYETNYSSILHMSSQIKANILCVNYRGVGQSEGFCNSSKEIVLDGSAMVQYLLDQGVEQKDIIVYGYSLGGGVGAQVVALEKFKDVRFISDRSFSSLYIAIKTFFWIPVYKHIIAYLVKKNWGDLDSFGALKDLTDRVKIIVTPQDYLIGFHEASLYYKFVTENLTPPHTLSLLFKDIDTRWCFLKCRDLAKTHYWDLPKSSFPQFTESLFSD